MIWYWIQFFPYAQEIANLRVYSTPYEDKQENVQEGWRWTSAAQPETVLNPYTKISFTTVLILFTACPT